MMVHQCHLIFPQAQMEMLWKIIFQKIVCWWVKLKFSSKSQGYHNQQKMEIWWEKWAKVVILYHQRWTFVDQSIDFTTIQENSPATQQALPSNSKLWKLKLTNFPHWSLGFYGTKIKNEGVHQKLWWWSFHVGLKVVPPTWPKLYPGASRFLPRRHVLASAWRRRGITNVTPQVTNGFLLENKLANLRQQYDSLLLWTKNRMVYQKIQSTMISHQSCFARQRFTPRPRPRDIAPHFWVSCEAVKEKALGEELPYYFLNQKTSAF